MHLNPKYKELLNNLFEATEKLKTYILKNKAVHQGYLLQLEKAYVQANRKVENFNKEQRFI